MNISWTMFEDRKDAGKKLAQALKGYKNKNALVLAIPRGGVEIGYEVAKNLNADFSVLISRKLPFPDNPESGFGAIAEDGSTFIFQELVSRLPEKTVRRILVEQQKEIERRISALREGNPLPGISGKTVILTDDGLAMGSTMRAAVFLCRKRQAAKIVVAVPVASALVAREFQSQADEVVILEKPPFFRAVAQVYRNWYDVSDREVLKIMDKWNTRKKGDERNDRSDQKKFDS